MSEDTINCIETVWLHCFFNRSKAIEYNILFSIPNLFLLVLINCVCVPVCVAINAYRKLIIGKRLVDIYNNFSEYWRELVHEDQLRWVCIVLL